MFSFRNSCLILIAGVIAAVALPAVAAEDQFYFVARNATVSPSGANRQVYLRWDNFEGRLPSSVATLQLERDGVPVGPGWPANGVMLPAQIAQLYAEPGQQRLKLETITRLNELATQQGNAFSPSQFATTIYELINPAFEGTTYNPLWAFLGSRTDFNVARARYRGWLDTDPGEGATVRYELKGIDAAGTSEVRLGLITVDMTQSIQPLGASGFKQIRVIDTRCDLPEAGKDQFTVMLNWYSPGEANPDEGLAANAADKLAAQAYTSGFDIYRGSENLAADVTTPPALNIASLAAAAATDSRGIPEIAGLEKVNVSLIIDPGVTIDNDPKWVEAQDLLKRAGLRPGDRRAYYLVPRDFTGNYGPAVATIVEVPELARPPAPWNLRAFADETSSVLDRSGAIEDAYTLIWDPVNIANYQKMYQGTRLFCSSFDGVAGILEYVPIGGSCETDVRMRMRINVRDYKVYRFYDFDIASRFKDSDGDGVSDDFELDLNRDGEVTEAERNRGLQCNPDIQAPGPNYLVPANEGELLLPNPADLRTPQFVRFRDRKPAGEKDTVFWYRIASEATTPLPNGRLSFLSAPQRALFPDREPPLPPLVEITKPGKVPEGCRLESDPDAPDWSFTDELNTDPKGTAFSIEGCGAPSVGYTSANLAELDGGDPGVGCQRFASECAGDGPFTLVYPASKVPGGKECRVAIPNGDNFCESGAVRLVPDFVDTELDVNPGDLIFDGPTISVQRQNDRTCIALYENMDGSVSRLGSSCDPEGITYRPRGRNFCGYAVATDENNNISTVVQIPCTLSPSSPKPPSPPQILALDVDNSAASFAFRIPAQKTAVVLARLTHDPANGGSETRQIETVSVIDDESGDTINSAFTVPTLQASRDRFCLSLLSIARDNGTGMAPRSEWSAETCFTRSASGEDIPDYLPWPLVKAPIEAQPLTALLAEDYRAVSPFLFVELGRSADLLRECERILPGQTPGNPPPPTPESELATFDSIECTSAGVAIFKESIDAALNFLLYRQSRTTGEAPSDWVQVAPLIDYVHFDRIPPRPNPEKGASAIEWRLNDPFIKTILAPAPVEELYVLFIDPYPFTFYPDTFGALLDGDLREFRYQAVYFDKNHKLLKWRESPWFRGDSVVNE